LLSVTCPGGDVPSADRNKKCIHHPGEVGVRGSGEGGGSPKCMNDVNNVYFCRSRNLLLVEFGGVLKTVCVKISGYFIDYI